MIKNPDLAKTWQISPSVCFIKKGSGFNPRRLHHAVFIPAFINQSLTNQTLSWVALTTPWLCLRTWQISWQMNGRGEM